MNKTKLHPKIVTATLLMVMLFALLPFAEVSASAAALPSPNIGKTFPSIYIDINMEDIDREEWQDVTVTLDNTIEEYKIDDAAAEIRGRGNSTWTLEKKPFRIRFKEPRSMLDSGHASRTWTFLADHSDKSLMRNYSAYTLASRLDGMYTAPFARHVNVYLGGEYQGVYLMSIQTSEIAEGRVNLTYDTDPAICEYLIEMDNRAPESGAENVDYITVGDNHYALTFPSGDKLTPAHVRYIKDYITTVDNAIAARDNSVFSLINLPSFIDYYIVQELYKNVDIGFSSVFMQIRGQGETRALEMGPVWDFDISAGNAYHVDYFPQGIWAGERNTWYKGLSEMPGFYDAMVYRWNGVKNTHIRKIVSEIKNTAKTYSSQYSQNFLARWDTLNTIVLYNTPEMIAANTHAAQIDYLTKYLQTRTYWLDNYFNKTKPAWANLTKNKKTGWVNWGSNRYYLDNKSTAVTGWLYLSDSWYYFDDNGAMVYDETINIDGINYVFDINGKLIYGGTD